jgi:hypothetical protein
MYELISLSDWQRHDSWRACHDGFPIRSAIEALLSLDSSGATHPRTSRPETDQEPVDFDFIYDEVRDRYGIKGNVSVPPPAILRMMLLLVLYDVRSERELMNTIPLRLDWLAEALEGPDPGVPDGSRSEHDDPASACQRAGGGLRDGTRGSHTLGLSGAPSSYILRHCIACQPHAAFFCDPDTHVRITSPSGSLRLSNHALGNSPSRPDPIIPGQELRLTAFFIGDPSIS